MLRLTVEIKANETATQQIEVYPWEVPLVQSGYAAGSVTLTGKERDDENPPPDPAAEWERLVRAWGIDKRSQERISRVEKLYGDPVIGIQKLAQAIQAAGGRKPRPEPEPPPEPEPDDNDDEDEEVVTRKPRRARRAESVPATE